MCVMVTCKWHDWENLSSVICKNKGQDQPAHPRSIISNFVVCFLRIIIPRHASCEKHSIFYLACLAEGTGLRLALSETQKTVACVACLTALGQIFQVQHMIILKTNIMRRLFIGYINRNHSIWLCSTSSNTQVIRNYGPQSRGNGGGYDFLATGLWYDPVLTAHLPGLCVSTNDWCT